MARNYNKQPVLFDSGQPKPNPHNPSALTFRFAMGKNAPPNTPAENGPLLTPEHLSANDHTSGGTGQHGRIAPPDGFGKRTNVSCLHQTLGQEHRGGKRRGRNQRRPGT